MQRPPSDRYSSTYLAYEGSDPSFATIGANRPFLRLDVAEPDGLRWYDHDGTLIKKSTGLVTIAIHEADNLKLDFISSFLLMGG